MTYDVVLTIPVQIPADVVEGYAHFDEIEEWVIDQAVIGLMDAIQQFRGAR